MNTESLFRDTVLHQLFENNENKNQLSLHGVLCQSEDAKENIDGLNFIHGFLKICVPLAEINEDFKEVAPTKLYKTLEIVLPIFEQALINFQTKCFLTINMVDLMEILPIFLETREMLSIIKDVFYKKYDK